MPKSPITLMRPYFGNAFDLGLYPTHMHFYHMLTILNFILYALPKVFPSYLFRWAKEEALHSHIKKIILVSFQSFFFLFFRGWANGIGLLQKKIKKLKKIEGHPFN